MESKDWFESNLNTKKEKISEVVENITKSKVNEIPQILDTLSKEELFLVKKEILKKTLYEENLDQDLLDDKLIVILNYIKLKFPKNADEIQETETPENNLENEERKKDLEEKIEKDKQKIKEKFQEVKYVKQAAQEEQEEELKEKIKEFDNFDKQKEKIKKREEQEFKSQFGEVINSLRGLFGNYHEGNEIQELLKKNDIENLNIEDFLKDVLDIVNNHTNNFMNSKSTFSSDKYLFIEEIKKIKNDLDIFIPKFEKKEIKEMKRISNDYSEKFEKVFNTRNVIPKGERQKIYNNASRNINDFFPRGTEGKELKEKLDSIGSISNMNINIEDNIRSELSEENYRKNAMKFYKYFFENLLSKSLSNPKKYSIQMINSIYDYEVGKVKGNYSDSFRKETSEIYETVSNLDRQNTNILRIKGNITNFKNKLFNSHGDIHGIKRAIDTLVGSFTLENLDNFSKAYRYSDISYGRHSKDDIGGIIMELQKIQELQPRNKQGSSNYDKINEIKRNLRR